MNSSAHLLDGAGNPDFLSETARMHDLATQTLSLDIELGRLMEDALRLETVAARSSRHDLGFDRVELWRDSGTDFVLRLHIWWGERLPENSGAQDIHNHGRPLAVFLLCGGYRSETWVTGSAGRSLHHYRYTIDDVTLQTSMEYLGEAKVVIQSVAMLERGHCYTIHPEALHRVLPYEGVITASFVLQGPIASRHSDVFTGRRLPDAVVAGWPTFNGKELLHKLGQLRQALRAQNPEPTMQNMRDVPSQFGDAK